MSAKSRVALEKLPTLKWLDSGTPSSSSAMRLPPMPRIVMPSVPKRDPDASCVTPGTKRKASASANPPFEQTAPHQFASYSSSNTGLPPNRDQLRFDKSALIQLVSLVDLGFFAVDEFPVALAGDPVVLFWSRIPKQRYTSTPRTSETSPFINTEF